MKEIWKKVDCKNGNYEVSNYGRVRSIDMEWDAWNGNSICHFSKKGSLLKPFEGGKGAKDGNGYLHVSIDRKTTKVHRLVAKAFIPNPDNLPQINHINGNKKDNRVCNLEWCSCKSNVNHAVKNGLMPAGETSAFSKLTAEDVKEIRETFVLGDSDFGYKPLARKYGVSSTTIKNIVNRKKWRIVA